MMVPGSENGSSESESLIADLDDGGAWEDGSRMTSEENCEGRGLPANTPALRMQSTKGASKARQGLCWCEESRASLSSRVFLRAVALSRNHLIEPCYRSRCCTRPPGIRWCALPAPVETRPFPSLVHGFAIAMSFAQPMSCMSTHLPRLPLLHPARRVKKW